MDSQQTRILPDELRTSVPAPGMVEQEFLDGIKLAEAIGENRVRSLLIPNLAVAQAMQGLMTKHCKLPQQICKELLPL